MIDHPDYFRYKFWFMNDDFETVSDVVGRLIEKGYATEFSISKAAPSETLFSRLNSKDLVIDEAYFFSEDSEAGQNVIIIAVSSERYKVKGIFINGFASDSTEEFMPLWSELKRFFKTLYKNIG